MLPTPREIDDSLARRSFRHFVRQAWPIIEPGRQFQPNWHIDAICEHLEAIRRRELKRLLINVPFRTSKSTIVSALYQPWIWIDNPEHQFAFLSHGIDLAIRDNLKARRLIQSAWYQELCGGLVLRGDQNQKTKFENERNGHRQAFGMSSGITGSGGDTIIVDDPHDRDDAHSDAERTTQVETFTTSVVTRLNDPDDGAIVIIMQRLHEADLSGEVLKTGDWEHLMIPMKFEPDRKCSTSIGWQDPRKEHGELMWPARFSASAVAGLEKSLGSSDAAGQLQQNPSPADGDIFKAWWFRYWKPKGSTLGPVLVKKADGTFVEVSCVELPDKFDDEAQSWDMAFKDTKGSDFVSGGVWSRLARDLFMRDLVNERLDFTNTCKAVRAMSAKWPNVAKKLVEDKANGPAVINTLRSEIGGLVEVEPEGGKVSRMFAAQPWVEGGNIYLPHPDLEQDGLGAKTKMFLSQMTKVPNAANDDICDQFTQAVAKMIGKKSKVWEVD